MKSKIIIAITACLILSVVTIIHIVHDRELKERNSYLEKKIALYDKMEVLKKRITEGDTCAWNEFFLMVDPPNWDKKPACVFYNPAAELFFYSLVMIHKCNCKDASYIVIAALDLLENYEAYPDSLFYPIREYYYKMYADSYYERYQDSIMINVYKGLYSDSTN